MKGSMFYTKKNYPDGDFYVELQGVEKEFTFKLNTFEDLWELTHIVDVLNHNGIIPCVTIPNLISCQADKRFAKNQSFGYSIIHKFLGNLKAVFKIYHPHQEMCSLLDNVEIIDNSEFISEVLIKLLENYSIIPSKNYMDENLILMSSDAGGFKPLIKLCDKLNWKGETYSASKSRQYIDGKSILTQIVDRQDFKGKNILIIDDICVYGGTFKGLSKMLRERNCGKLYLAVSHMTVQNLGEDPVTNYFDKVFTTNSKFNEYHTNELKYIGNPLSERNLEIIKLF